MGLRFVKEAGKRGKLSTAGQVLERNVRLTPHCLYYPVYWEEKGGKGFRDSKSPEDQMEKKKNT